MYLLQCVIKDIIHNYNPFALLPVRRIGKIKKKSCSIIQFLNGIMMSKKLLFTMAKRMCLSKAKELTLEIISNLKMSTAGLVHGVLRNQGI